MTDFDGPTFADLGYEVTEYKSPSFDDFNDDPGGIGLPMILFVGPGNGGRSQMAAGWMHHLASDLVRVRSAGVQPAAEVDPIVVESMAAVGVDLSGAKPTPVDNELIRGSDMVVTLGCRDAVPVFPEIRYDNWDLPDPTGKSLDEVRVIREQIRDRVRALVAEFVFGQGSLDTLSIDA
jgi:arsenate reductase